MPRAPFVVVKCLWHESFSNFSCESDTSLTLLQWKNRLTLIKNTNTILSKSFITSKILHKKWPLLNIHTDESMHKQHFTHVVGQGEDCSGLILSKGCSCSTKIKFCNPNFGSFYIFKSPTESESVSLLLVRYVYTLVTLYEGIDSTAF